MNNIITIMRRDLGAYFTSPIGYIFMMVFVTLSVGLYISTFFAFPIADMRPYFDNLPLFFCVFIPAVTMRIWAEERKENTWEMLLTFPMQAWELVLGKFAAALVFFGLTLASTVTIPVMLIQLGNPDYGAMISGYFGTLLLGAFMLSLGILFSGFFKDQIVAFAVTLLTCFAFFLLGTTFFAAYLDDLVPSRVASSTSPTWSTSSRGRSSSSFSTCCISMAATAPMPRPSSWRRRACVWPSASCSTTSWQTSALSVTT